MYLILMVYACLISCYVYTGQFGDGKMAKQCILCIFVYMHSGFNSITT